MHEDEITEVLGRMPPSFEALIDSIRTHSRPTFPGQSVRKLIGLHPLRDDISEIFSVFRATPWHVTAYEDSIGGIHGITVTISRKDFVNLTSLPRVEHYWHVTAADRVGEILNVGIRRGCDCGITPRCGHWLDSPFYIHVSTNREDACWWAGTLYANQQCALIPIRIPGAPPIYADPGSRHPETGVTTGFIIDDVLVSNSLISEEDIEVINLTSHPQ